MRRYNYANSQYVDNGDLRDALAELMTALDLHPESNECPTMPEVELMQADGTLPEA